MQRKAVKLKRCRVCPTMFAPCNSTQVVCSPGCAIQLVQGKAEKKALQAEADRKRKQKAVDRKRREELKTKPELTKEAQAEFNRWVRLRDHSEPCISCGMPANAVAALTGGYWDCGHYRSVGSAPALRFEPLNAHKQCKRCNRQLSGNIVEYRIGLIERIGLGALAWLEGPHPAKNYTHDDLREIRDKYRKLAKELQKSIKTNEVPCE